MWHVTRLMCVVLVSFWLVACSESPQEKIVGKWQAAGANDGNILEFYPDGTITFEEAITGISVNGEYTFLNDEKVKIEMSGILALAGSTIYTISFADGQMMLEGQNSAGISTYSRLE